MTSTVLGMGALSTDSKKSKSDNAEGAPEGGDDGAGSCSASNGDNNGSDSVEAKDTLFVKELRSKAQVRGVGGMGVGSRGRFVLLFLWVLFFFMFACVVGWQLGK